MFFWWAPALAASYGLEYRCCCLEAFCEIVRVCDGRWREAEEIRVRVTGRRELTSADSLLLTLATVDTILIGDEEGSLRVPYLQYLPR